MKKILLTNLSFFLTLFLFAGDPVISIPTETNYCDESTSCLGKATMQITVMDECATGLLSFSYQVDLDNNETIDFIGEGSTVISNFGLGTHRITWTVKNACDGESSASYLFAVKDCEKPNIICKNGISLPLLNLNSNGCVEVWATDLLDQYSDNCTSADKIFSSIKLRREGTSDELKTGISLCCEDGLGTQIVEVWGTDEAGNSDYSITYLIVTDSYYYCEGGDPYRMAGCVKTINGNSVNADIHIKSNTGELQGEFPTIDGCFFGAYLNLDGGVFVSASRFDPNKVRGISTRDIILLLKHILGSENLTNPYQGIAADVNNDGSIDVFDVLDLRKLLLHIDKELEHNKDWRFFDASVDLTGNPFGVLLPEVVKISATPNGMDIVDFVAVKIGDVSGDACSGGCFKSSVPDDRSKGVLNITLDDVEMVAGQKYSIPFKARDFNSIQGFQFTLNMDGDRIDFQQLQKGALMIGDANIGTTMKSDGILTVSWADINQVDLDDETVLFTLDFLAKENGTLSDVLSVNSRFLNAEAYRGDVDLDVNLIFEHQAKSFILLQNLPNPFEKETTIRFVVDKSTFAILSVYDTAGNLLYEVEDDFIRGYHEVAISSKLLKPGVLFYKLETQSTSVVKKMIMIK